MSAVRADEDGPLLVPTAELEAEDELIVQEWSGAAAPARRIMRRGRARARPALLAGVSIVEHQGPAMLAWLQSKTIGQNRTRFSKLASAMLSIPPEPETLSLLQHI